MSFFIFVVLYTLIIGLMAVTLRELYYSKPGVELPVKRVGFLLGYILILIAVCIITIKIL
jgi:hypothetical protein